MSDQAFLRDAERELAELMADVSGADVRHGPKRRTIDQARDLLEARRDAMRLELDEIGAELAEGDGTGTAA
jgi:hypothetical protein